MPPAVAMGVGMGVSGIGSMVSAKASQPKMIPTTPPNAMFPWLNKSYGDEMAQAGPQGIKGLQSMAATGEPVSVGDSFSTMLAAQQRLLGQGRAGLREQFGSQGLAGSSSFRDAAVDFEGQQSKDFANILANMVMQSGENAANRKLTASGTLADMFGTAGQSYTPSSVLSTGGTSATGTGLTSGGNSLMMFAMLKQMGMMGAKA